MQFSSSERETFFELMKWRRDVRHFRRDPVAEDMVQALKTAMDHAPSVGNARPWRIFSVESQAKRKAVHHIFTEANQAAAQIYDGARASQYHALKLEGIETAPVQLAVFTDTAPAEGHGLGRQSMASTLEQSTAMAVQNLNLAARSFGLGAGMVSVLDPQAMEQLFEVPPSWRFTLYLCIGWPCTEDDTPLLHRNGWQENRETFWRRA
ncbi:5,6-dimethylbenzimidazole synthase [Brucella sp. 2716]|uniref:5,6-dimethylbenzimidazole synthase n=1 Tax=Brucella sp. 2716 TaxID=2975052 RepID=UPI00217D0862|nr:5,6-dimethylbenzimidazole synthase [Brucella sp. 2716]UWF60395.1 5,6-dimethylbenzimidazole synthase [Brucella sp. 2716]